MFESPARVTLFAGHYGSGKTNIALAYARALKHHSPVTIADLDIVNPYFRTKDSKEVLSAEGIELVVSDFANSNVDFPALPKELYSVFSDSERRVVADIGGDDRGALALGRYAPDIIEHGDYEFLAVVNASRPLTRTPEATLDVLREIESSASGLKFTGLVNNTNLGSETTAKDILSSREYAARTAALVGVPLKFTCCKKSLYSELKDQIENLFPIDLQKLYYQLDG